MILVNSLYNLFLYINKNNSIYKIRDKLLNSRIQKDFETLKT